MRRTDDEGVDFQRKVCSGDTTEGLNRQIEEWQAPLLADVATVSMGGNDLGFSDLVDSCVLRFWTYRSGAVYDEMCKEQKRKAHQLMDDASSDGLRNKLKSAYMKILDKSGREDFHVYVTSYVSFFDSSDEDCDKTSFHYWWGGYDPPGDPGMNRIVMLKRALRAELNEIVDKLNRVISGAVDDANRENGQDQAHFVSVRTRFTNHRWCEAGDFHEPDANRKDTWFFLSGWDDFPIDDDDDASDQGKSQDEIDMEAIAEAGGIHLPDPDTCKDDLDIDADPYESWLCNAAEWFKEEPDSTFVREFKNANESLASGDFDAEHIPWYLPTRQIKTFHPRSPGMAAYRDAIISAFTRVQVDEEEDEETCFVDLTQIWTCEPSLYGRATIQSSDGEVLYNTPGSAHTPGVPITDKTWKLKEEGMDKELQIIVKGPKDEVKFSYGSTTWSSSDSSGSANCELEDGDDWSDDGPGNCQSSAQRRTFKCSYSCRTDVSD